MQTCVVHLIRAANRWVAYGDRKKVSAALKKVYTAPDEASAAAALEEFAGSELGEKYPRSVKVWQDAWERFVPFLQFELQKRHEPLPRVLPDLDGPGVFLTQLRACKFLQRRGSTGLIRGGINLLQRR